MTVKKGWRFVLVMALAALCILAGALLLRPTVSAQAENSSNGTNTNGEWHGTQTTNNLIYVSDGTGKESTKSLAAFGWQNVGHVYPYSRHYTHSEVKLETESYGWGIQANNGDDDIGNSHYNNGVWYRITLSDADRIKAAKGDLKISASSVNYRQAAATHQVSLKLFFDNAAGEQIHAIEEKREIKSSAVTLSISDQTVPADTASIRYYVSNRGSLAARPFIGGLQCYLTDTKAPQATSSALVENPAITERGGAIKGDTVSYSVSFDEKVSVTNAGTAKISVAGTQVTASGHTLSTAGGIGTVTYSFVIPSVKQNGTISFLGVENCTVADEAGNQSTVSYSGSHATLPYYKTMQVTTTHENVAQVGLTTATYGTDYTATLSAKTGYSLPASIRVTAGDAELTANTAYTYNRQTGRLTIYGKYITDDIGIAARGVPKQYTVTLEAEGGTGGTGSVQATYNAAMPEIAPPVRTGYRFGGYFTAQEGGGTQYYSDQGKSTATYTTAGEMTLYAKWTANTYTVTYNANKPAEASTAVTGSTGGSTHTYDTPSALTKNGFSLTGWTFMGWATTSGGDVVYADGALISDLTAEQNGAVTLYAVWQPNTYTVTYDANKPAGASAEVTGSTGESDHTYDAQSALAINGFSLAGWTFTGWATAGGGDVAYPGGATVSNLTPVQNGTVTLYAVWQANTYTVRYESNRPSNASGAVAGATGPSSHVYDTPSALAENSFSLAGWTFLGWNTQQDGKGTAYPNKASVSTLVAESGGEITLYAVWQANTYTVTYDANKPAGASTEVAGSTGGSTHTYDTPSKLTMNSFSLTGWTFLGWNTQRDGKGTAYSDGASVSTLATDGEIALYGVWEANAYTISLNATGGSNSGSVGATFDSALPALPSLPARHGYNFLGYFDAETGGAQYYGADGKALADKKFTTDGDLELYAQWNPVTYTVQLYSTGNYITTLPAVTFGSLCLPSAQSLALSRSNFDFVGWNMYDEQNWAMYHAETLYPVGLTGEQDGVVVLYAAWQEKPLHTLSYDANGGIGAPAMIQVHEEETISLPDEIPTRADHTFLGWGTSASAESAAYEAGGAFTMGEAPVTLYAVWQHNHALTYHANGGDFVSEIPAVYPSAGERVTLTAISPTRTGYLFLGWARTSDAAAAEYSVGDTFEMPAEGDAVLYAVWEKAQYTIRTSAADGYTIEGLQEAYAYEETARFTVTGTSPKVYINGALTDADGGEYTFTVTGDTVVTVADGSKLSLIYDANGGSGQPADANSYAQNAQAEISAQMPSRTGYTFLGWARTENATAAEYSANEQIAFGENDIVLYAVWQANTYRIAYSAEGGAGTMEESAHTYGTQSTLAENTFTMEGHSFVGWALERGGAAVYDDQTAIRDLTAENGRTITLYAVWEKTISSVELLAEGGTGGGSFSVEFGGTPNVSSLQAPVRSGYAFCGYYTAANGEGEQIFGADMAFLPKDWQINARSVSLFAMWAPVTYSIVYFNGAEQVGAPQTVTYGTPFSLKTAEELRISAPENMSFAGWATYPGSTATVYTNGQYIAHSLSETDGTQISLYAVFAENPKWRVTYDANGGSGVPTDGNAYFAGETVAFPAEIPERYGYIFLGWSASPRDAAADHPYTDGSFETDGFLMPEGGITLYAVWRAGDTLQAQIAEAEHALEELSGTVSALQSAETANSDAIEALAADLKKAQALLEALDEIPFDESDLTALKQELQNMIEQAQAQLSEEIKQVQTDLDAAEENLRKAIGNAETNIQELQAALETLDAACSAADTLLRGTMSELEAQNDVIEARLDALETAYRAADEALMAGLQKLQNALDAMQEELSGKDADLEERVDLLASGDDRAALIYMAINLSLAGVAAILAIILIVRLIKNRKANK